MMPLQFMIKLNTELCSEKQITHQINNQIQKFKQVFKLFDEAKSMDTLDYVNKTDRVFISSKGKALDYKPDEQIIKKVSKHEKSHSKMMKDLVDDENDTAY